MKNSVFFAPACFAFFCTLIPVLLSCPARAGETPVIAVAANMSYAMTELIEQFQAKTGEQIRVSYGSSGNFTRQLLQGAPYELFLSADKKYARQLAQKTKMIQSARVYVTGRIGFFAPHDSGIAAHAGLAEIVKALQFGQYQRLVIANPAHAPYGIAARQALQQAGVWALRRKRLLLAENAAQAAQFSIAGGVDVGMIPYSLALVPAIAEQGRFFLVPQSWHKPIEQHLLLMQDASETTKAFYAYLFSARSKTILEKYGYAYPKKR